MVNVSQDIIKSFNEGNQQTALIEVTAGNKTFTITEADIIQGGLKIDRYCVTNSKIEVGSAVASELSLKLRNYDGKFNDVSFEGAVLNVKIGIHASNTSELGKFILGKSVLGFAKGLGNFILGTGRLGDYSVDTEVYWVPCGLFIVDTPPRKLSTISISALDYMVFFDREVNASALSFPIHVDALIQKICSICNVTLATDVSVLPNHYFSIGGLPDTSQTLTYRQLLQWCAQLTGTCAFMDGSGRLVLKWYEQTGVTITASERYSSDMLENDITITGFTCDDGKGNTYLSGTADYTLDLSDCGFLTNAYDGVLKELQTARGGFAYRPYSATIKSAPYLFPLDMIRYKDKDGVVHDTIVTNVTLALNCNTAISGAGETVTSSSYTQSTSGVTSQQAATDRANLEKINQTATQTDQNKQDLTQFRTEYSADIEKTNAAIEARVTKETYQTDMAGVSTRIGAAETKITQNADSITLRATKEELGTAKSEAISTAAGDASAKANAAESNAKGYTDAQLKITSDSITSTVSKTYATQESLNITNGNVSTAQNTANNALSGVNNLENRVGNAETKISQNADAITLRATKEEAASYAASAEQNAKNELYSMMTFTADNGLVITRSGWPGKVQITGDSIRVVRGNNQVIINDSGISITDGNGNCSINSGKITFSGLRQDKIWENSDPGSGIGNGTVICNDGRLSPYSAIVIGFGEYYTGLDGSGVNGSDFQYTVFPINGIWSIASRVWDYPRVRRVHVSYSGITFGQGGFYKENTFQTGVKFEKHDTCCVPCAVYGLM